MSDKTQEVLLKCNDLTIMYNGTVPAVKDTSFSINKGDCVLIVGRNGSGKSTLLKGILGLVPLKSGNVELCDKSYKKCIGYLPQQSPLQKDFPASVSEVVLSGFVGKKGFLPFYGMLDKRRVIQVLGYLGIHHLMNKSYRELSGGERQRVLLARALCAAIMPDKDGCKCDETFCRMGGLLVLDEPSNGLDPVANKILYNTIKKLNTENGMTVIMVSHLVGSAMDCANKVLQMGTTLEFFGSVEDYNKSGLCQKLTEGGVLCD